MPHFSFSKSVKPNANAMNLKEKLISFSCLNRFVIWCYMGTDDTDYYGICWKHLLINITAVKVGDGLNYLQLRLSVPPAIV